MNNDIEMMITGVESADHYKLFNQVSERTLIDRFILLAFKTLSNTIDISDIRNLLDMSFNIYKSSYIKFEDGGSPKLRKDLASSWEGLLTVEPSNLVYSDVKDILNVLNYTLCTSIVTKESFVENLYDEQNKIYKLKNINITPANVYDYNDISIYYRTLQWYKEFAGEVDIKKINKVRLNKNSGDPYDMDDIITGLLSKDLLTNFYGLYNLLGMLRIYLTSIIKFIFDDDFIKIYSASQEELSKMDFIKVAVEKSSQDRMYKFIYHCGIYMQIYRVLESYDKFYNISHGFNSYNDDGFNINKTQIFEELFFKFASNVVNTFNLSTYINNNKEKTVVLEREQLLEFISSSLMIKPLNPNRLSLDYLTIKNEVVKSNINKLKSEKIPELVKIMHDTLNSDFERNYEDFCYLDNSAWDLNSFLEEKYELEKKEKFSNMFEELKNNSNILFTPNKSINELVYKLTRDVINNEKDRICYKILYDIILKNIIISHYKPTQDQLFYNDPLYTLSLYILGFSISFYSGLTRFNGKFEEFSKKNSLNINTYLINILNVGKYLTYRCAYTPMNAYQKDNTPCFAEFSNSYDGLYNFSDKNINELLKRANQTKTQDSVFALDSTRSYEYFIDYISDAIANNTVNSEYIIFYIMDMIKNKTSGSAQSFIADNCCRPCGSADLKFLDGYEKTIFTDLTTGIMKKVPNISNLKVLYRSRIISDSNNEDNDMTKEILPYLETVIFITILQTVISLLKMKDGNPLSDEVNLINDSNHKMEPLENKNVDVVSGITEKTNPFKPTLGTIDTWMKYGKDTSDDITQDIKNAVSMFEQAICNSNPIDSETVYKFAKYTGGNNDA